MFVAAAKVARQAPAEAEVEATGREVACSRAPLPFVPSHPQSLPNKYRVTRVDSHADQTSLREVRGTPCRRFSGAVTGWCSGTHARSLQSPLLHRDRASSGSSGLQWSSRRGQANIHRTNPQNSRQRSPREGRSRGSGESPPATPSARFRIASVHRTQA